MGRDEGALIHYHGGPITPFSASIKLWWRRHAMVSFYHPQQIEIAAEVTQSFALDNGAFSAWKSGTVVDWTEYQEWVRKWSRHPGCDFAVIPDVIDGDESANDRLIEDWNDSGLRRVGVPVWHLHESLARLGRLVHEWPRVALGSSGEYSDPGSDPWWSRMTEAMVVACDDEGFPRTRLHGLRMMDSTITSHVPLSSADSTNVARNIGYDEKWDQAPYAPSSKDQRALILAERIESHVAAPRWVESEGIEKNLELFG